MAKAAERLTADARADLVREIAHAGGREVSFVAQLGSDGAIASARAVARGTVNMVLALPGVARRGERTIGVFEAPAGEAIIERRRKQEIAAYE